MHQIASGLNMSKHESCFDIVIANCDHRDCPTGGNLEQGIFGWLSPPYPWTIILA